MKKTLYILTLLLFVSNSYSQKEYVNWAFGNSIITFDTFNGEPLLIDSLDSFSNENTSVISNTNGDLMYFSGGTFLMDNNGIILKSDIDGNSSSRQGGCMFKVNEGHYIRVGSNYSLENVEKNPVLSFVNILNDNNGTSISNEHIIDSNFASEGLLLIKNKINNNVFLVVSDTNSNGIGELCLYKYKNDIFEIKQKLLLGENTIYHYFKYNSRNNLIVGSDYENGLVHFLRFNENTELIDTLKTNSKFEIFNYSWSNEFSPNGDFLYFLLLENGDSKFYRIEGLNNIENNELNYRKLDEIDVSFSRNSVSQMLLGPNNKIYIPSKNRTFLSSIENPDCSVVEFKLESVDLRNSFAGIGLPNIPASFYEPLNFTDTISVCFNRSIYLNGDSDSCINNRYYVWSGPKGFTSEISNPTIQNANFNDSGTYIVTVYNSDSTINYTREIVVNVLEVEDPKIVVSPDSIVCNADEVKLSVVGIYNNFKWTTGETTLSISVTESGTYGVEHINDNGCIGFSEVNIKFGDDITTDIIGPTEICEGSGEIYSADRDYETYKWSNGDDTKTTLISEAGRYWLEVTTAAGCTISDTIDISYHPEVTAELNKAPTTICEGDSVLLESVNDFPYYSYEWNTGATTRGIYAKETDTYKLTVTDTRTGCMDSTEIAISVEDNLQPTISGMDICAGNPATLEALPNDPSYTYEWSNGETTPAIVVSQPATYTVTVSKDGCSGTAEYTVNESPNPEFEILGEDIVCGNTATLSSNKDFAEYLWSTDEITKEIKVTEPGTYSLTITDENGCQATEEFTVDEQTLSFDISKDRIDFGKVYISETRRDSVTIINRSGIELTITDGTQNYTIPEGFPVQFTKTLNPTELGPYTDSFEYRVISPCDTVITIPVTAEVYAKVEISTKDIDTEIGAEETIPVYLQAEADLGEQTYTITTDIDKTVLFTGDDYTFTQTAPINKSKTQIHEISGMIMLASELEYEITFSTYEFNNPYIEVSTKQGTIKIDSVCAFPQRSITFTEKTEMKVSPNPARDRLVVDIISEVNTNMKLELITAEGRVAYTENWTQTDSEKQVIINTDKIPSGLYQVRLSTLYGVLTDNVIVVK